MPKLPALHVQMFVGFLAGLLAGLTAFTVAPDAAWLNGLTHYVTQPIGQMFLRLLFMLVIPLLFSALVIGIAELGDAAALKRVGIRAMVYTLMLSAVAVAISLLLVNLIKPGVGVDAHVVAAMGAQASDSARSIVQTATDKPAGIDALLAIIPSNIVKAMAENDILAVMFFALFFGIGMLLVRTPATEQLRNAIEGLFQVSMRMIEIVIRLAPIAITCFMFNLASQFGWDLLVRLGAYVGVVLLALGLQMLVVYPLALRFAGRVNPIKFFGDVQEALLMAFSTASSNATLPTALRVAETRLALPPKIARFVLTIGATANQNGTAIFEGVTVLFLAQFFGVELTLYQQFVVLLMCILGGIGTAGVPAGSLPVVALILGMVGVPPEGIGLVLGIDRFLDMCRTTLNVAGDLTIAAIVSKGESDADRLVAQG